MPTLYFAICLFSIDVAAKFVIAEIVITFFFLAHLMLKKNKIISLLTFALFLFLYVCYVFLNEGFLAIIHSYFYTYVFMFMMLILCSMSSFRADFLRWISQKKHVIRFKIYIVILFLLFAFSIFFMNGFRAFDGYETKYFVGPFSYAHPIAYIMLSTYAAAYLYRNLTKEKMFFSCIQILSFLFIVLTGVRSAFLAIIILIFLDILSLKQKNKIRIILLLSTLFICVLASRPSLILNNPVFEKTIVAASNGSVSNGRETFRQVSLEYFHSTSDLVVRFFGVGMSNLVNNMYAHIHMVIHAHNDYVNLLVGYGYLGFVLMILCQAISSINFKSKVFFAGYHVFIFILAYFNGFALYSCMMMSFPFISLFFSQGTIKDRFLRLTTNFEYVKRHYRKD